MATGRFVIVGASLAGASAAAALRDGGFEGDDEAMTRHEDCAIGMKRLKEIYRGSSDEAHC